MQRTTEKHKWWTKKTHYTQGHKVIARLKDTIITVAVTVVNFFSKAFKFCKLLGFEHSSRKY